MKCISPIRNKLSKGFCQFSCGRCRACRANYASMWALRMFHELKFHDENCFATLTYNDSTLPKGGTLVKRDPQLFLKRLRKNTGKKIRYYLGGEYGENYSRPHYHAILFGIGRDSSSAIEAAWQNGFVYLGSATMDSCNYVARYITKKLSGPPSKVYEERGVIPEFCLMSRRPGIGGEHVEKYGQEIFNRGFLLSKGRKVPIPRYYVEKVYNTDEKRLHRELALAKLQKENHLKTLDKFKEKGYSFYEMEPLRREGTLNLIQGRSGLKPRR